MAWVVMRRFRTGGEAASTKSFKHEKDAMAAADEWAKEGWEVEVVSAHMRGGPRKLRVPDPEAADRPDQPGAEAGPAGEVSPKSK
ncbi:MAG: hypothetical protein QOE92_686 [Chloroflexota bacterium]|jgi:hypothetical protein|nr:hypothetical protein [Chloroflexota bacterium]